MAIDFTEIVLRQLAEPPPPTRAERDLIYEEIHTALNRMFAGRESTPEHFAASLALQKAIGGIEAGLSDAIRPTAVQRQPAKSREDNRVETTSEAEVRPRKRKRGANFWRVVDRLNQIWSVAEKLGKAAVVAAAAVVLLSIGYWFFWSEERELPTVQRGAIEQTACKPISKEQCDFLIAAVERTKNRGVIAAANAGNLGPAEELARQKASEIQSDPKSDAATKQRAAADADILNRAVQRLESEVKRTADGVERMDSRIQNMQRENDPVFVARRELAKAGYKIENTEFIRAVAAGDSSSEAQFHRLGIMGDLVSLRAGLLAQAFGNPQFENLLSFVSRTPPGHYAKTLMTEGQQFAQTLKAQNSLDRLRKDTCETQPTEFFRMWAAKDLKPVCKDEPIWLGRAIDITQQLAKRLGDTELWETGEAVPFQASAARQVKSDEFIQLIGVPARPSTPEIVSARVAVVVEPTGMYIYSQNMKEYGALKWTSPARVVACGEQDGLYPVCEATVSAFVSGKGLPRAIAVASVVPNPSMRSIASLASTESAVNPKWLIGVMARPNPNYLTYPLTRAIFADHKNNIVLSMHCVVTGGGILKSRSLAIGRGAPMQQLLQEAFSDRAQSEPKEIALQFNGETQRTIWDKPSRTGFNTVRIGLNGPLSEKIRNKGFTIFDRDNRLGTFEPVGISQAMDEVFKGTPCQQA